MIPSRCSASSSALPVQFSVRTDDPIDFCHNFIRLSETLAHQLHDSALQQYNTGETDRNIIDRWLQNGVSKAIWVPTPKCCDFLPIQLWLPMDDGRSHSIFVSYNGGCVDQDQGQGGRVVNLSQTFLSSVMKEIQEKNLTSHLFPHQIRTLQVQPLPYVLNAASIQAEPLSSSDWELLEIYSSEIENGGLLKQVSIVYPNQCLTLILGRRDVVHIRVCSQHFISIPAYMHILQENKDILHLCHHPHCLRLIEDTQVIIIPKPRKLPQAPNPIKVLTTQWSGRRKRLRVQPHEQDFNDKMLHIHQLFGSSCSENTWINKDMYTSDRGAENDVSLVSSEKLYHKDACLCTQIDGIDENSSRHARHVYVPDMARFRTDNRIATPPAQFSAWVHPSYFPHESSSMMSFVVCMWKYSPFSEDIPDGTDLLSSSARFQYPSLRNIAIISLQTSICVEQGHVVLHPNTCAQLNISPLYDHVWVEILSHTQIQQLVRGIPEILRLSHLSIQIHPLHLNENASSDKEIDLISRNDIFDYDKGMKERLLSLWPRSSVDSNVLYHDRCIFNIEPTTLAVHDEFERFQLVLVSSETSNSCREAPMHPFLLIHGPGLRELVEKNIVKVCKNPLVTQWSSSSTLLNLLPSPCIVQNAVSPNNKLLIKKETDTGSIILALCTQIIYSRTSEQRNDRKFQNVMIFGQHGSGKTYQGLLAAAILRSHYHFATVFLDCKQLQQSSNVSNILAKLSKTFFHAIQAQPSLIVLDDLDILLPDLSVDGNSTLVDRRQLYSQKNPILIAKTKLVVDHLIFLLESLHGTHSSYAQVFVICTAVNEKSICPELLRATRFSERIELSPFRPDQRLHFFESVLRELQISTMDIICRNRLRFMRNTEGHGPADILSLAMEVASMYEQKRLCEPLSLIDEQDLLSTMIVRGLESYIPLSKQVYRKQLTPVLVKWNSLGGLFKVKKDLERIILRPVRYQAIYRCSPISLPRGILLFGPPGCGKSCIVPALADHMGFNLVTCQGPEVLDKYIGMSEAKVRRLFEEAYALSPCILFFDDFDALASKRGRDSTGVTDRVVNQLLTYLDGVEGRVKEKGLVYVIAATSRPDKVDPALLRPGRLESHIFVGPPETRDEWQDLFVKVAMSRQDVSERLRISIQSGDFTAQLTDRCIAYKKLTPVDVKSAFDDARISLIRLHLVQMNSPCSNDVILDGQEVLASLAKVCDQVNQGSMAFLNDVYDTFRCHSRRMRDACDEGVKMSNNEQMLK